MSWHQDQVIEKPAAAEIAGLSAFCKYAALSYGDRALTIQPYPEFDAVYVADLVVARRTMLPDNLAEKTLTGLDKSLLSAAIADQIEVFFKKPRGKPHVTAKPKLSSLSDIYRFLRNNKLQFTSLRRRRLV
jgi:hypothetical protein